MESISRDKKQLVLSPGSILFAYFCSLGQRMSLLDQFSVDLSGIAMAFLLSLLGQRPLRTPFSVTRFLTCVHIIVVDSKGSLIAGMNYIKSIIGSLFQSLRWETESQLHRNHHPGVLVAYNTGRFRVGGQQFCSHWFLSISQ
jgi:hypothetical protein